MGRVSVDVRTPVQELLDRSHRLGSDPRVTNYAGGNTSAKGSAVDPVTGGPVDLLWVKGSGGDLGTLTAGGLAILRLDRLRALRDVYSGVDREDEMVAAFDHCLFGKGGAAPSIDTAMPSPTETGPTMWHAQKTFPIISACCWRPDPELPTTTRASHPSSLPTRRSILTSAT